MRQENKVGGGLASIEDSIDASIPTLEESWYGCVNSDTRNNTGNNRINRTDISRKQK